ncbi:MAG: DUF547 domain-containing protein [Bacteroidota bacterium]
MKKIIITAFALGLFVSMSFAQMVDQAFFDKAEAFFQAHVENGTFDYAKAKGNMDLESLIQTIETADLNKIEEPSKKAFLINAYNLLVIRQVTDQYPIETVQENGGFFDKNKVTVGGKKYTLTQFEKQELLDVYEDARLHFVLNCAAISCPKIVDFAYQPAQLEEQLNQQTTIALDDPTFLKVMEEKVELSKIFEWYIDDFGGNRLTTLTFVNKYKTEKVDLKSRVGYYTYDWTLNDKAGVKNAGGNNSARYVVSSTIPKGFSEAKIFNNLYTQASGSEGNLTDRSTFFTTLFTYLYGVNNRLNVGFSGRYRRVSNESLPNSALNVFGSIDAGRDRQGLTAIGPQIRYAPFTALQNFSVQSSFLLPVGSELTGSSTQPFIDWNGATWWTQFFNDLSLGSNFSLFTEVDFLWEDIGSAAEGRANRVSTPATVILSYFPNQQTTIYTLAGYSPFWQSDFDYFTQLGLGFKYQFTPNFEVELLATDFDNKFLNSTGGRAYTYNMGVRFNW